MPTLTIAELTKQLKPEEISIDYDNIPDEFTPSAPPLEPGIYTFQLPASLEDGWEIVTRKVRGVEAERVQLVFGRENPLVVIAGGNGKRVGEPFLTRIANAERNRAKKGEPEVFASDMTYLLKALGDTSKPKNNIEYLKAMKKYGGQSFQATIEWQGFCNPGRQAYANLEDADGTALGNGPWMNSDGTPHNGCGNRMYNSAYKQADGSYTPSATCVCGATVRPFAQLRNFSAAKIAK